MTNKCVIDPKKFLIQIFQVEVEGKVSYLEAVDEHLCNWMMFVRPATCYKEQNMIAHQYGNLIYYTTVKPIEPKHELRVCETSHYNCLINYKFTNHCCHFKNSYLKFVSKSRLSLDPNL